MNIDISDNIIIFDEAHNIEDICRDTGSIDIATESLENVINDCNEKKRTSNYKIIFKKLRIFIQNLNTFIMAQALNHEDGRIERISKKWTGKELKELFAINNLDKYNIDEFIRHVKILIGEYNQIRERNRKDLKQNDLVNAISQSTKPILEEISYGLEMITADNNLHYRACIIEKVRSERKGPENNIWYKTNSDIVTTHRVRILQLICMNPALIFKPISDKARTVILASGTLTPTASFESELGTKFPHFLNANHIIPRNQVHVQCIDRGPSNKELRATYQNVNQFEFKDDIGEIILKVCKSIPHGVLCFFSSYNMMQQHTERWRTTGLWPKILDVKEIFVEPQRSSVLIELMTRFRETIEITSSKSVNGRTGAIIFGVYRGKFAEGIDFSNNEARCVIAIGIPYPVLKQPSVKLKYDYNNSETSRGLLAGSEWYSIQAFRALNQALGRCIRHKNDWGAILLIDSRFNSNNYFQYLPKWIKNFWIKRELNYLEKDLQRFVLAQQVKSDNEIEKRAKLE